MKKIRLNRKSPFDVESMGEGETIEMKLQRVVNNNEPIEDTAPIIYTARKDGVRPEFDCRADRWDIAITMQDWGTKTQLAKRQSYYETKSDESAESTQDTTIN